ncbi:hypothetical protein ACHAL6_12445 [Proteiniclasticum sp. C24MP]|uniref:hypothetical protein n=1 Tax=Proteiniclasticum sp. C24MP TaxID=3374101 RepID=UPI0037544C80
MEKKIIVEVFGVRNKTAGGSCSCNGGCAPAVTMGEMYNEFETFMKNSEMKDQVELQFIDVYYDDLDDYKYIIDAMNKGFGLPLTSVNGELKLFGGVSGPMVLDLLQ